MCCCGQPNVNGTPGYRWQPNDPPRVYPVDPPDLREGDVLLFDEPGRCGGVDAHCYHYRIVTDSIRCICLLYRHGGGDGVIRLSNDEQLLRLLPNLGSDGRYWMMHEIYHAADRAARAAGEKTSSTWARAAVEKRIKLRRRRGAVRVEIVAAADPVKA